MKRVAFAVFSANAARFSMVLAVELSLVKRKAAVSIMKIAASIEGRGASLLKRLFAAHF